LQVGRATESGVLSARVVGRWSEMEGNDGRKGGRRWKSERETWTRSEHPMIPADRDSSGQLRHQESGSRRHLATRKIFMLHGLFPTCFHFLFSSTKQHLFRSFNLRCLQFVALHHHNHHHHRHHLTIRIEAPKLRQSRLTDGYKLASPSNPSTPTNPTFTGFF
jgi:hypothetical protein